MERFPNLRHYELAFDTTNGEPFCSGNFPPKIRAALPIRRRLGLEAVRLRRRGPRYFALRRPSTLALTPGAARAAGAHLCDEPAFSAVFVNA